MEMTDCWGASSLVLDIRPMYWSKYFVVKGAVMTWLSSVALPLVTAFVVKKRPNSGFRFLVFAILRVGVYFALLCAFSRALRRRLQCNTKPTATSTMVKHPMEIRAEVVVDIPSSSLLPDEESALPLILMRGSSVEEEK